MSDKDYVEHLFVFIRSMYRKKEGSPTDNKDKFLKRKQRGDEEIAEYAEDLKDSLYQEINSKTYSSNISPKV